MMCRLEDVTELRGHGGFHPRIIRRGGECKVDGCPAPSLTNRLTRQSTSRIDAAATNLHDSTATAALVIPTVSISLGAASGQEESYSFEVGLADMVKNRLGCYASGK